MDGRSEPRWATWAWVLSLLAAAGKPRDAYGTKDLGLRDFDTAGPLSPLLA